jgi:hypothetical protein
MGRKYEISTNSRGEVVAKQGGYYSCSGTGQTVDEAVKAADRDRQHRDQRMQDEMKRREDLPWFTYLD